jgi:hypothetical protein
MEDVVAEYIVQNIRQVVFIEQRKKVSQSRLQAECIASLLFRLKAGLRNVYNY